MNAKEFKGKCPELIRNRVETLTPGFITIKTKFLVPVSIWTEEVLPFLFNHRFILYSWYEISGKELEVQPIDLDDPQNQSLIKHFGITEDTFLVSVTFKGSHLK